MRPAHGLMTFVRRLSPSAGGVPAPGGRPRTTTPQVPKPPGRLPRLIARPRGAWRALSPRLKIVLPALVVVVTGGTIGTYSAFTATSQNPANSFAAGTVTIGDDDAGGTMFTLSGMKPADAAVDKCIEITYTGSLPAGVGLWVDHTGGNTVSPYLQLTVTRGTLSSPSFPACTNFTADTTNWIGSGAGVIYSGLLSAFPTTSGTALRDPTSGSPETWTQNEKHAYKLTIDLNNDPAAQGLSQTNDKFYWGAQNE